MKYKLGDKTLLGEIDDVDKSFTTYSYRIRTDYGSNWFSESEIDAIICKPKRNVDQTAELLEKDKAPTTYELCRTSTPSKGQDDIRIANALLEPYIEPRKYPVLTPEELKAVKWLVEGGFNTIRNYKTWVETSHSDDLWLDVKILPTAHCLESSAWITETPIDLKELLEAQDRV